MCQILRIYLEADLDQTQSSWYRLDWRCRMNLYRSWESYLLLLCGFVAMSTSGAWYFSGQQAAGRTALLGLASIGLILLMKRSIDRARRRGKWSRCSQHMEGNHMGRIKDNVDRSWSLKFEFREGRDDVVLGSLSKCENKSWHTVRPVILALQWLRPDPSNGGKKSRKQLLDFFVLNTSSLYLSTVYTPFLHTSRDWQKNLMSLK